VQAPGRWPESSFSNWHQGPREGGGTPDLASTLSALIGASLGAGDCAVMIAAPTLQDVVDDRLRDHGIDVVALRRRGRYRTYTTSDVLSNLMSSGSLDGARLREVLGEIVTRAAAVTYRVFAYSDLASTLEAAGNQAAAAQLTEFWQALPKNFSQPVRCADSNTIAAAGPEAGTQTRAEE